MFSIFSKLKKVFYFPVAYYFRFFAGIHLKIWKPRIVVVTGSSGKTTLLHFIEAQLRGRARYSHHANSAYGIPFDILGLVREKLTLGEWPYLFFAAPFKAFKKPYPEALYVVEADCDRPGEGRFLSGLLKPEVTVWLSSGRSHSMNFGKLVPTEYGSVEEAIAYEFGYFLENTSSMTIANGDLKLIVNQYARTTSKVKEIKSAELEKYIVMRDGTGFYTHKQMYKFKALIPQEAFYSLEATRELLGYLQVDLDSAFSNFNLPPGRGSILRGIRNTTLIDSSYNATFDSMVSMLGAFDAYPSQKKWLVLGDILEQGAWEREEHEKLAALLASLKLEKLLLVGPRVSKYTYPKLKTELSVNLHIERFSKPSEVLDFIEKNIKGGETILFKGAGFLEGVVEHLLQDNNDVVKLCRREKIWQTRRKQWGL